MAAKQALVYGGCGALGRAVVDSLKAAEYSVFSVDLSASNTADKSIIITGQNWEEDTKNVKEQLKTEGANLSLVVSVAGGWAGGNIKSDEIFSSVHKMYAFNTQSAVAASHVAAHFMKEDGLVVLTGAHAAFDGTPGMIGYGLSKASTHHLVRSLAAEGSGLPAGSRVVAVCPITLDTEMNRKWMPKADHSTWTSLEFVGKLIVGWGAGESTPESGSMVSLITKGGVTELVAKEPKNQI